MTHPITEAAKNDKHTPEPWEVVCDYYGGTVLYRILPQAIREYNTEENRANCRLMQASPKMKKLIRAVAIACDDGSNMQREALALLKEIEGT